MRRVLLVIISLFLVPQCFAQTFKIGIVPQQSQVQIARDWQPIIKYLEEKTGHRFILMTAASIPDFENLLYSGGYDIAYANPYHYVVLNKKIGYTAEVRSDKDLVGILVTNKHGPYKNVSMLKGKRFLFPAPDAFAATLLIKYELKKYYSIDLEKDAQYSYVNSHDSVYKGVARNIGDAGGGIERTLNDFNDQESKDSLVIIHKTKAYPSHPIVFKSSIRKQEKDQIVKALISTPPELLTPLKIKNLVKTSDKEYDGVRDIAKILSSHTK